MSGGNAALLVALALVPVVLLTLTSYVKISVVLSLVRNAIGAPDAPSSLVVTGLSLVLTFFVMAPVAIDMVHAANNAPTGPSHASAPDKPGPDGGAVGNQLASGTGDKQAGDKQAGDKQTDDKQTGDKQTGDKQTGDKQTAGKAGDKPSGNVGTGDQPRPSLEQEVRALVPPQYRDDVDTAARAAEPLRSWLGKHAGERDRTTFTELAGKLGHAAKGDELWVIAPAFVTTELRQAFAIAALIFLPFIVIDLVVGLGLAALGLQSTRPDVVALPLKLLLFVAVDGWRLLVDALLRGYA